MWCPVTNVDNVSPSARTKHSATLVGSRLYLLGGRNGNVPLKDMWMYDLVAGKWTQLKPTGDTPPCLQEHTTVYYKNGLYVFGGELGFSAGTETPLWYFDLKKTHWRKIKTQKGVAVPLGRRGHTALVHRGTMLIYGGYQDLRGSSNELWAFHFETESWHLLSSKKSGRHSKHSSNHLPPPRHKHSAIMHDDAMWVYGGMTDLQERGDLWKWCTVSKTWYSYKVKNGPGSLHSHAVCKLPGSMLIFGGESNGQPTNELWKFNFAIETWTKVQIDGLKPQPRAESIAFAVSELVLKPNQKPNENPTPKVTPRVARPRTSTSVDRSNRHSSYLPQNRVTPCERTYVFQPTTNNYIDDDENDDDDDDDDVAEDENKVNTVQVQSKDNGPYHFKAALRDDSYSSHLGAPIYQNIPKSTSVKFNNQYPELEEVSDENVSTSDYASLEGSNKNAAALAHLNKFKSPNSEGPFGFSNPNYLGPDIQELINGPTRHSWSVTDSKAQQYAKSLNTPDSGVADVGRSTSRHLFLNEEMVEMQYMDTISPAENQKDEPATKRDPPTTLDLNDTHHKRVDKCRASSASRVEKLRFAPEIVADNVSITSDQSVPLFVFVVGGKEQGQITVFKRPISFWRLKIY